MLALLRYDQARKLEWVVIPFSRGYSWPRDWTWVSGIAGRFFTIWATKESSLTKETNLCLTCLLKCPTVHVSQKYYSKIGKPDLDSDPNVNNCTSCCLPFWGNKGPSLWSSSPSVYSRVKKAGKHIWSHKQNQGSNSL